MYTESINWDEFALMARAQRSHESGTVQGGGRPGLGTLLVLPAVVGCTDPIETVVHVRLAWLVLTTTYLLGVFALLRYMLRRTAVPWLGSATGVALLALVPVFHRWSLQVRTDQLALALGIWAGWSVLASRRRLHWAWLAGGLSALSYLATQKAVYLFALTGVLAVGDLFIDGDFQPRRELRRAGVFVAGALIVSLPFRWLLSQSFRSGPLASVSGGLELFAWYREIVGFQVYRAMLPTLVPHLALCVGLLAASIYARRRRTPAQRTLLVAWAVLLLGIAVGLFHAAAFPYFWITLGLFPAMALALALEPISQLFSSSRSRALALGGLWALLVVPALPTLLDTLLDTQRIQRESLAFVARNYPSHDAGFQVDGALFCRPDRDPFPVYLREHVVARFEGRDAQRNISELKQRFLERPVKFIVGSHRLMQFPAELREFWGSHYATYYGTVMILGRELRGAAGTRTDLQLIAAGRYRWWVHVPAGGPATSSQRLRIDGTALAAGQTIDLSAGRHVVELETSVAQSALLWDLPEPPAPAPSIMGFFSRQQLREITGIAQNDRR